MRRPAADEYRLRLEGRAELLESARLRYRAMLEVVGESGVLVDPYSVESIKNGLLEVLCNPDRREELRQRGLERAKLFTWAKAADELYALVRKISGEANLQTT